MQRLVVALFVQPWHRHPIQALPRKQDQVGSTIFHKILVCIVTSSKCFENDNDDAKHFWPQLERILSSQGLKQCTRVGRSFRRKACVPR